MPIDISQSIRPCSRSAFHGFDYQLMGICFGIHNSIGRLFDESIYQAAVYQQCLQTNLSASREVEIKVSHESFSKSYYIDLLVEDGIPYELKTTESVTQRHESQLLNYILLTGVSHGKIVNFRTKSIECRFVSTSLRSENRRIFQADEVHWEPVTPRCRILQDVAYAILQDWGTHLDTSLYREALIHFLGGESLIIRDVPIITNGVTVGTQKAALLDDNIAIHVSSVKKGIKAYTNHLRKFLSATNLSRIQWVNLQGAEIYFNSLKK